MAETNEPVGTVALDDDRRWYVIHTYSGYENKVKQNLRHRIDSMEMQDQIFRVIVPTEEEIELKNGERRTVQKKVFPGYVLVQMKLTDELVVRGAQHARRYRLRRYWATGRHRSKTPKSRRSSSRWRRKRPRCASTTRSARRSRSPMARSPISRASLTRSTRRTGECACCVVLWARNARRAGLFAGYTTGRSELGPSPSAPARSLYVCCSLRRNSWQRK